MRAKSSCERVIVSHVFASGSAGEMFEYGRMPHDGRLWWGHIDVDQLKRLEDMIVSAELSGRMRSKWAG
jgi:hypothetical protein